MPKLPRTMTVQDLIDALEDVADKTQPVFMTADYGDHAHTTQALTIRSVTEAVLLEETGYSKSGWAVADNPDGIAIGDSTDDEADPDAPTGVILQ